MLLFLALFFRPANVNAATQIPFDQKITYSFLWCEFDSTVLDFSRIGVARGSTANKANMQMVTEETSDGSDDFYITKVGAHYKIVNKKTKKVLDVNGGSKKAGANVQQYAWNGTKAQLWDFVPAHRGHLYEYYIVNVGSGMVLERTGWEIGKNVRQAKKNTSSTKQTWFVYPNGTTGKQVFDYYSYKVRSAVNVSFELQPNTKKYANGLNVCLKKKTNANRSFWFVSCGNGYYAIAVSYDP